MMAPVMPCFNILSKVDDPPVSPLGSKHIVGIDGLMRPMKRPDTKMHNPGREARRPVLGTVCVQSDVVQRGQPFHQVNGPPAAAAGWVRAVMTPRSSARPRRRPIAG